MNRQHIPLIIFGMLLNIAAQAQNAPWQPPEPDAKSLVWIKLPSGEWLAGHVKSLRDKEFVFNSEELDEQTFDFDDIIELRSPVLLTFGFEGIGSVTGTAVVKDSMISIRTGDQVRALPRANLLSIIEGERTEWNYWSLKANVGMVARSGNTDQTDLNSAMYIRREAGLTRIDLNYTGNFSKLGGVESSNNHNAGGTFNWLITRNFFVTPLYFSLLSDNFQNLDLRTTIGAGVGYFIVRTGEIEWSVGLAGGYQTTTYHSVLPGEELTTSGGIIIPSTALDMDLVGGLEMVADYSAQVGLSEPKNTYHRTSLLFTIDALGDALAFTLSFTWDYNTNPQSDENGVVPKKSDVRTSFGIGVDI